jgi:hypothetical protein
MQVRCCHNLDEQSSVTWIEIQLVGSGTTDGTISADVAARLDWRVRSAGTVHYIMWSWLDATAKRGPLRPRAGCPDWRTTGWSNSDESCPRSVPRTPSPRSRRGESISISSWGALRLSATVTSKFFSLYHFSPLFFISRSGSPLNTPPIPHYHYKISFSIPTINFLSTNNYLWIHSTVFRVMNSDTLDLGGERRGPTRRVRCRGHRCGHRVPPTADMQGERER